MEKERPRPCEVLVSRLSHSDACVWEQRVRAMVHHAPAALTSPKRSRYRFLKGHRTVSQNLCRLAQDGCGTRRSIRCLTYEETSSFGEYPEGFLLSIPQLFCWSFADEQHQGCRMLSIACFLGESHVALSESRLILLGIPRRMHDRACRKHTASGELGQACHYTWSKS